MLNKKVTISAGIKLLTKNEVLKYVPDDIYNDIKKQDAHPMFAMMSIGHEGTSTGELFDGDVSSGKKLSNWYKQLWPLKAVKELVTKMRERYLPIYESHDVNLAQEQRIVVGNIVASIKKTIKGISHAVGIAYINNYGTRAKIESGGYDACSLEAECVFEESDNLFRYIVTKVKALTGIALVDTSVNQPGFDKANILAVVTAMAKEIDDDDDDSSNNRTRKRKGTKMNLEEIKKWMADNKIGPEVLFTVEELTAVPTVIDAFENERKEKTDETNKKIKALEEELVPFRRQSANVKVAEHIRKSELLKDEYKEVVDYLTKTIAIDIEGVDNPQEKIDAAVKEQLKVMDAAKFRTKTGENEKTNKDKKNPDTNTSDTGNKGDNIDYTDAKDNELIPEESEAR